MSKKILATYRENAALAVLAKADEQLLNELVAYLQSRSEEVNLHIRKITKQHVANCEQAIDIAVANKLLPPDLDPRKVSITFGPSGDGAYYRELKQAKTVEEVYAEADKTTYVIMQKPHPIAAALMEALT